MIRTVPLARATGLPHDRRPRRPPLRALPLAAASREATTPPSSATTRTSCRRSSPSRRAGSPRGSLSLEARTLDRRELEVAREAMPSRWWPRRGRPGWRSAPGVPVACLPMAIPRARAVRRTCAPATLVDRFRRRPRLLPERGGGALVRVRGRESPGRAAALPAVRRGAVPRGVRRSSSHPAIRFLGYVDDVGAELSRHRAFVAPMVEGTGVKTKVLEAMAAGLPVVTTSAGVRGLAIEDGVHCLMADTGEEFRGVPRAACPRPRAGREDRRRRPRVRAGVLLARA